MSYPFNFVESWQVLCLQFLKTTICLFHPGNNGFIDGKINYYNCIMESILRNSWGCENKQFARIDILFINKFIYLYIYITSGLKAHSLCAFVKLFSFAKPFKFFQIKFPQQAGLENDNSSVNCFKLLFMKNTFSRPSWDHLYIYLLVYYILLLTIRFLLSFERCVDSPNRLVWSWKWFLFVRFSFKIKFCNSSLFLNKKLREYTNSSTCI